MFKENCLNLLWLVIWVKFSYKKLVLTSTNFFCHREKFFFCRPAQQVIFLCTSKHNHTANFKKFLNTGQGGGQRVGTYRYNHIYLLLQGLRPKNSCMEIKFSLYMFKEIIFKNFHKF